MLYLSIAVVSSNHKIFIFQAEVPEVQSEEYVANGLMYTMCLTNVVRPATTLALEGNSPSPNTLNSI